MKLHELSRITQTKVVTKAAEQGYYSKLVSANGHTVEIQDSGFLMSLIGQGKTKRLAHKSLLKEAKGKILVVDAYQSSRVEYSIPE